MTEGLDKYGLARIQGFTIPDSRLAKTINDLSQRCNKRCDTLVDDTQKKNCGLKCKIFTQQKIIAAIKQTISKSPTPEAKAKYTMDLKRAQVRLIQYQRSLVQSNSNMRKVMVRQSKPLGTA